MELRFGITMREINATSYNESRDAIARDWPRFISKNFPKQKWLLIPNILDKAVDYIISWNINVLILSGGDDIGKFPERDDTEIKLLDFALRNKIPVIGVCRGLQLIHNHFGGKIEKGDKTFKNIHNSSFHNVYVGELKYRVNSFHTSKILENTLNKDFEIIARCSEDNSIECFKNEKIMAMMWHPERESNFNELNLNLIKNFLFNG